MHTTLISGELKRFLTQTRLVLFVILLFAKHGLYAQTTVNSLNELLPYLSQSNVNIKMTPGKYQINSNNVGKFKLFPNPTLLLFSGSNSTYDFTDVVIEIGTIVFQSYGNVDVTEVHITGSNNVLKNLKLEDIGDFKPSKTALGILMDGSDNRVEGFHQTVRGSYPYGYGDIFGKGSGYVIKHYKHSAILVRGNSNHLKNCTIIHRAYGHGIFCQGSINAKIEGCYVEGELRTTDDVLAEAGTGSAADQKNFMSVWGYIVPPGYMFSKQEDGIRAYNTGLNIETGLERNTETMTVIDCTVKNMRSGVTIGFADGEKYVENCTSIGCENAFWIGSNGKIVNSRGDAKYGQLYCNSYQTDKNNIVDLTVLDNTDSYGNTIIAYLGGSNQNITFRNAETNPNQDLKILISGIRTGLRFQVVEPTYNDFTSSNIELHNLTRYPAIFHEKSSNCLYESIGKVTDLGKDNKAYVSGTESCEKTLPALNAPSGLFPGIRYKYYEGSWNTLPVFDQLVPQATGTTTAIGLTNRKNDDYFGFVFEGFINIPESGNYTFYTSSDDGSRLFIDDLTIVDNDGLHGIQEKSGSVCLAKGYHKLKVEYFEKTGGNQSLSAAYSGPGFFKKSITDIYTSDTYTGKNSDLFHVEKEVLVYPNPASEVIYIVIPEKVTSNMDLIIRLYSAQGQNVKELKTSSKNRISMNISNLPKGVYFLEIVSDLHKFKKQLAVY